MGSVMDQDRPWEVDPENWYKTTHSEPDKKKSDCRHEWKSKYDFVYDYDHQYCTKCSATRMV